MSREKRHRGAKATTNDEIVETQGTLGPIRLEIGERLCAMETDLGKKATRSSDSQRRRGVLEIAYLTRSGYLAQSNLLVTASAGRWCHLIAAEYIADIATE
jgi:hypothetical protein